MAGAERERAAGGGERASAGAPVCTHLLLSWNRGAGSRLLTPSVFLVGQRGRVVDQVENEADWQPECLGDRRRPVSPPMQFEHRRQKRVDREGLVPPGVFLEPPQKAGGAHFGFPRCSRASSAIRVGTGIPSSRQS